MDILSLHLKIFKQAFYAAFVINTFATLATYIAGINVFSIVLLRGNALAETNGLLLLLIVAAIFQTAYQKKLLKQLDIISDLDEKAAHYFKIYKLRLYWKCASCFSSCFIHILTGRNIFLYFAIFDVLTTWTYFPNKALIRRELKTEDVLFVEE